MFYNRGEPCDRLEAIGPNERDGSLLHLTSAHRQVHRDGNQDGFVTINKPDINVFGGQTVSVDFELKVGDITQRVEVTGEAPVLDTTSANMGVTTSEKLIESLPITLIGQAARSAIQSVAYLPGVASVSSNGQYWTIISRAQINGVPPGMFGYEIDGLYAGAGAAESAEERVTPVPEQITEIRLTNNTDASQGFNGGVTLGHGFEIRNQ